MVGRKVSEARRQVRRNRRVQDFEEKEKKNDDETDQEEKEFIGSLTEKKLFPEGYTGRNGEREKSSGQKKISGDRRHKIYGSYEETNRKAENRKTGGSAIWPYNHNVFVNEDFAPDELTDRPLETEISETTAGSDLTNSAVPAPSAAEETVNVQSESTTSVMLAFSEIDEIFNTSITLRFSVLVTPKPSTLSAREPKDDGEGHMYQFEIRNPGPEMTESKRNPVANASYNGWEDHRANHTIPPFWLDDRPPLLRHVGVRPAAGWSV
ncbi:hypothetical protein ANN_19932 [Periplaneta americana]|uniref:Uncharacterized protein n=1 Tax=Periplaneta americana TaxID=6978 RepID=A0ABQ8SBG2_PERAM|nr:hypothetical protein ANN_19932 [Periplaneta americana]